MSLRARAARAVGPAPDPALLRLVAHVAGRPAPVLAAVLARVGLPVDPERVAPRALFAVVESPGRARIRTRSEFARGVSALLVCVPEGAGTRLTYSIVVLPGDESIRQLVLQFETDLVRAVRHVDPTAAIRLLGSTRHVLRAGDGADEGGTPGAPRAA